MLQFMDERSFRQFRLVLAALYDLEILGQSSPDQDFQSFATLYATTMFVTSEATTRFEFVVNG